MLSYVLLAPFVLGLCACPYSSSYKLDAEPGVMIDESFIGKWATFVANSSGNELPMKMIVDKKNDFEYNISFTGNIKDLKRYNVVKEDTVKASAFISEAASRRFLNVEIRGLYYIVEFIYKDDKVTLLPLSDHFTSRLVRNNNELKISLEQHYKTRLYPLYDDDFCLRQMMRVN